MVQSGDARQFARFHLARVPSPCFVVDRCALEDNLKILAEIKRQSGAKIFLALKAFSMFSLAPVVSKYLDGVCASGVHEARLGREAYCKDGGALASFSAAYKASDMEDIIAYRHRNKPMRRLCIRRESMSACASILSIARGRSRNMIRVAHARAWVCRLTN